MAAKSNANSLYSLDQPGSLLKLADELKSFVTQNKLTTTIGEGEHLKVEAWQYLGAQLGLVSLAEETVNLSTEREFKYATRVALVRLSDGFKVGQGYAICSSLEARWRNKPEYAIASMSATRAVGRAYRNGFAWIVKAAGYETTPVEELESEAEGIPDRGTPERERLAAGTQSLSATSPSDDSAESPAAPLATAKQKKLLSELLQSDIFEGDPRALRLKQSLQDDLLSKADATTFLNRLMDDRKTGEIGVISMRRDLAKAVSELMSPENQSGYRPQIAQVWNLEQYENLYHLIRKASESATVTAE